ncbi:SDR family NAD(P)-dependent oxidoreductase [Ponticaulis profundi]|uniref:SDR family NAD(P)-dependent oxidoreductase n=1 Tax=Ponticaulis profundi TaxID=2665222 RepID=A0ABW1SG33_9PROT
MRPATQNLWTGPYTDMDKSFDLNGKAVLITGAASGIGRQLAHQLAYKNASLILCDISEPGLRETISMLPEGRVLASEIVDVGDAAALSAFAKRLMTDQRRIDVLINNAGVAIAGSFDGMSLDDFEWLMNINFWATVRLTKALLPHLKSQPIAQIVNLSSLFGLIAPPGQTAYCASKFAVRGFSESLRLELADTNVAVTQVHPGGIATNIANSARGTTEFGDDELASNKQRMNTFLTMPPERAACLIIRAIEKRQTRLLIGKDAKGGDLLQRLFPNSYGQKILRMMR